MAGATLAAIEPLPCQSVPLLELTGRVAGSDVVALVDVPSTDVSSKDGYALRSEDVKNASDGHPRQLRLIGAAVAGGPFVQQLPPGTAVRVLSGAGIPMGADAVLAEEYASTDGDMLRWPWPMPDRGGIFCSEGQMLRQVNSSSRRVPYYGRGI